MILKILGILYVISMLSILLVGFWRIISIFICRKKKNCQNRLCPLTGHCEKVSFTEEEITQIKELIEMLDSPSTPECSDEPDIRDIPISGQLTKTQTKKPES